MENGAMSDPTVNESEALEAQPVKQPGFMDPEVRKRAMEQSLAVRRGEVPEKVQPFQPSKSMLRILEIALQLDSGDSVRGWFAKAGLSRGAWFEWQKNPQFREWWKKEFAEGVKEYETKWILIGLKKMSKDFRYWNEVGKKIFGFIDKIAVKEEKSPEEQALYAELLGLIQSYKGVKNIEGIQENYPQRGSLDIIEAEVISELKEGVDENSK
jgi:hypothetical protein